MASDERVGTSMYPWEKWLNGQVWFIRTNTDFRCMESSIRSQAHMWAMKLGVALTTRLISDSNLAGVMLQAYPIESTWKPNLARFPLSHVMRKANADNSR
jgi:hypothetical protein